MINKIDCVAIRKEDRVWSLPKPKRHYHIIAMMNEEGVKPHDAEQGFLLTDGTFVDREEARKIALEYGQISDLKTYNKRDLFSEDLW